MTPGVLWRAPKYSWASVCVMCVWCVCVHVCVCDVCVCMYVCVMCGVQGVMCENTNQQGVQKQPLLQVQVNRSVTLM